MKRFICLIMIMCVLIVPVFSESIAESEKPGVYGEEIQFQELIWGSNDRTVVNKMSQKGIIKKYYFNGSGYQPGFCWPEEYVDLAKKNVHSLIPLIIRENHWIGLWKLGFTPLKLIGGHDAKNLFFSYVCDVDKKLKNSPDHLVAVTVEYEPKSNEMQTPELFIDLLKKLTSQYGTFKIFINKEIKKNERRNIPSYDEVLKMVEGLSPSVNKFFDGIIAFAYIKGANDTAIALRWYDNIVELVYSKTDTYKYIHKIEEQLMNQENTKQDIGL